MATKLEFQMSRIAEGLRGGLSGWDFKNYIFAILFYRFISLKIELPALDKHNLAGSLTQIFQAIEASDPQQMQGLFDGLDFHSSQLGKTSEARDRKLLSILDGIDMGSFSGQSTDVFGDIYEYLLNMYAQNSRKSGGEFYTPQEVSELVVRIAMGGRSEVGRCYDPTCGSGSLLLRLGRSGRVTGELCGQEINPTTYNLCRMNMILHGLGTRQYQIAHGDTLADPHDFGEFDVVVSNPPYSIHWDPTDHQDDPRFTPAEVLAPRQYADLAFVMHILSSMAPSGVAAVVCYPGSLYRGHREAEIRQYLIKNSFVDACIELPENLFFGTSINVVILALKKERSDSQILMISAKAEYLHSPNQNRLSQAHIDKIVDCYLRRAETPYYSQLVSTKSALKQGANLIPSLYVERKPDKEIDILKVNERLKKLTLRNRLSKERFDSIMQGHINDYITTGRVAPWIHSDGDRHER